MTRIGADGDIGWDQRQFFNNSVESAALDVVVDGGNVFVFGLANNASEFLGFSGDAWVARVSLGACYSPVASDPMGTGASATETFGTSDGTASNDDSTSNDGPTTALDPDTTTEPTDTETTGDTPPAFDGFTVNGSTTPPEVAEGGTVLLEADVSDDVGVASVEFFDGATSLGTVTDTPYALEIVVSSADSGSHTYTALATDTAGQTRPPNPTRSPCR